MASANVLHLTDENFDQEVMQSDVPALVDFWAEWCMPCRMIAPVIDELADEFAGRVKIGKVNTDESHDVALKMSIQAIPTLLLFSGGRVVKKFVGLQQKKDLKAALEDVLG